MSVLASVDIKPNLIPTHLCDSQPSVLSACLKYSSDPKHSVWYRTLHEPVVYSNLLFFINYRDVANEQINYGLVINSPLNINDTVELSLLEHHWRVGNCINESIKDRFINYLEFLNLGLIKHGEYIRGVSLGASPMFLLGLCAGHLWSLKQWQKPEYNPQINISMYMYLAKHSIERCDNMTNLIITLVNMICCIRDTDV